MARWTERARQRLRDGETVEASVPVGGNAVVVTNQRLLVFAPEGEGRNFRAVERPNVEDVRVETVGDEKWVPYIGRGALLGLVGLALGLTVEFESLLAVGDLDLSGAGATGVGGLVAVLESVARLLAVLDDVLLVGGLLALAAALGAFGMYVESRQQTLVIGVAGGDDVHVLATEDSDAAVDRIKQSLTVSDVVDERPTEADPLGPQFE